jgi:hypothetical protein
MKKFEREFKWSLTKDEVESYIGPISDEQFNIFCNHFETTYLGEYERLLETYRDEWKWMKPW